MKILFAIDKSDKRNLTDLHWGAFVLRETDDNRSQEFSDSRDTVAKADKISFLPFPFNILKYVCLFAAVMIGLPILRTLIGSGVTFEQGYHNAPYLYYIFAGAFPLAIIFVIWDRVLRKKYKSSREYSEAENDINEMVEDFSSELGIPDDAEAMNVIHTSYKVKNGKVVILPTGGLCDGLPFDVRLFFEDDMLCIAGIDFVLGIRRSEIRGIRRENKTFSLGQWTKKSEPTSKEYKEFKMTVNSFGQVFIRWYYIVDIERDGEQYQLYIPSYERDTARKYFGDCETFKE